MADMRERIREQTALAQTYADEGAYHSAGRVLRDIAKEVEDHAHRADEALQQRLRDKFGVKS